MSCFSNSTLILSKAVELVTSTRTLPTVPFFVWMIITPLAAPVPQTAAAAAPFNTVTFSISSGLKSFKRDCSVTPAVPLLWILVFALETGIPSIIINGEEEPVMVFCPLIWI